MLLITGHSKLLSSKDPVNRKILQTLRYNNPSLIAAMNTVKENQIKIYIVSQGSCHENNPQEDEF